MLPIKDHTERTPTDSSQPKPRVIDVEVVAAWVLAIALFVVLLAL